MDNKDVFANNLRKQMELKGVSRNDIADALGISYFTVTDWVNGKKYPRMDKVEKLAGFFGIPKSDLIEEQKVIYIKDKTTKSIGKNVKTFREDAKMSQKQLADLLGVEENVVIDIENGTQALNKKTAFRICDIFHTTPDFLDGTIIELLESGDSDAEYRYMKQKEDSPDKLKLTEGEKLLLDLFRQIPEDQQKVFLEMGRVYANSLKKD